MRAPAAVLLSLVFLAAASHAAPPDPAEARRLRREAEAAAAAGGGNRLEAALRGLVEADGGPDTVDFLVDLAVDHPEGSVYGICHLHLVHTVRGQEALARLEHLATRDPDEPTRIAALEVCGARKDPISARAVAAALGDRDWRVLRTAVRAAGRRRLVDAVPALIELFAASEDDATLVFEETRKALSWITGERFGSAEEWRSFWAAQGEGFVPPPPGHRRGGADATRTRPRFFGSELCSSRVVLVIDVSGSMAAGRPPRILRVKQQLHGLIESLPEDHRFAFIAYSGVLALDGGLPADAPPRRPLPPVLGGQQWLWQTSDRLFRATKARQEEVRRLVSVLEPSGFTFTFAALRRALEVEGADLVVLLSDGVPDEIDPATGRRMGERAILEEVARLNRFRRLRIDTFGLGSEGDAFLQALARQSGGKFTHIRD